MMNQLYFFHALFWFIYYLYATYNPSDSIGYYLRTSYHDAWLPIFGTDTKFIEFIIYPFIKWFGFSYESCMFLFSWFGYLGFIYFYIFFKENVKTNIKYKGFDLIILLLFLPNMHFWTASLGKGSLIFLGIGLFTYAMRTPQKRIVSLLLGAFIVYCIRPHMFLFLGVGAVLGFFTGQERVPLYQKLFVYIAFAGSLALMYDQILAVANIDAENPFESFDEFAETRAGNLAKAGSGVDMNSYSLPVKLFTFWFRPLFFDASGALALYISIENLLYLLLTWKLFDKDFIGFFKNSSSMVKMSSVIFISSSIALSFVMANLGIVIRQKSQVMYFLFFVIIAFMEYKQRKKLNIVEEGNIVTEAPRKRLRVV
ncbi:hypothetical protein GCM10028895_19690 [Pontibacter rugosus]